MHFCSLIRTFAGDYQPKAMNIRVCRICLLLLLSAVAIGSRADERLRSFVTFDASYGLADNSAQTIMCTKTGRIVISTIGHINFYDGMAFTHIDPSNDDIFPLPGYNGHYHLYFDKFHHLWLKDKKIVTCVDLLLERFIPDVGRVMKEIGFKGTVEDLFGDHDNHMWYLSRGHLTCPEYGKSFPVRSKMELQDLDVHDSTLLLQFFADGMVSAYDIKTEKHLYDVRQPLSDEETKEYDRSSVVFYYDGNYYQIRNGKTKSIIHRFNAEQRQWTLMMQAPYHLNNIAPRENLLYIACEYGYWVYDLDTGKTEHFEYLTMDNGRPLLTDINAMAFDRQGGMWLGTQQRGLLYSRPYPSPFKAYTWEQPEALKYSNLMDQKLIATEALPRPQICIYTDSRGWKWTGTYTGLQLSRGNGTPVRTFMVKDGLKNEMIRSIVEDDFHNIWVSTSYGISRLMIRDDSVYQISSYNQQDNVPNESFVNNRAMKLDDGTIVMQALDHVIVFKPSELNADRMQRTPLMPKLTRLLVNGREISPGVEYDGNVILDRAITRTKNISLNYNQNSLSLSFSGLNFWRPGQTFYRVRVKGVHDKWRVFSQANSGGLVDNRGIFHLPLMGLRPGKYAIELQASMTADQWDVEPFVWEIVINQPWWRSTGVYILLIVLMVALLLVNMFLYNRNTRLRLSSSQQEDDMLKRICNYAYRCSILSNDVLTPYTRSDDNKDDEENKKFIALMLKIVPYINSNSEKKITMDQLVAVTGLEQSKVYDLMSANLYKSPQQIVTALRLKQAADLLMTTSLAEETIANQCGFVSPNFFIASFYHQYRQTPHDYRNSAPR